MADYLRGPLWLPFVEPAVLRHGIEVDETCAPNIGMESCEECAKLMKVWDAKGLLDFFASPVEEGLFCRVFNAFKNDQVDRQIGDRRRVNMSELSYDGPSRFLPTGLMMTQLHVKRFSQRLVASVTDRRDFYHQAAVSLERARTNMLPFCFQHEEVEHFEAWPRFLSRRGDVLASERRPVTSLDLDFRVTGRGGVPRGSFLLSAPSSKVTTLGSSLLCVSTKPSLRMNIFWSQVSRFSVGMSSQRGPGPGILDLSLMTISLFTGSLFMLKRFTRLLPRHLSEHGVCTRRSS